MGTSNSASVREVTFESLSIGEQISGGGFCILYKGEWMGIPVAIKRIFDPVITKELRDEYDNEVNMLSTFRHPHVVSLICAVKRPPSLCIVTEFMQRNQIISYLSSISIGYSLIVVVLDMLFACRWLFVSCTSYE
jgi:hypothetical protein